MLEQELAFETHTTMAEGLTHRPRRLRRSENLRRLVRETALTVEDLVYPLYVVHGRDVKEEIPSMPGVFHWSLDLLPAEVEEIAKLEIPAVMLFGLPARKDEWGSEDYDERGIVQQAIRVIKRVVPNLVVMSDVCMCQYTSHGHCGVVKVTSDEEKVTSDKWQVASDEPWHLSSFDYAQDRPVTSAMSPVTSALSRVTPEVLNDETLEYLARIAVSHAAAGADIVAPSGMMDGQVGTIRRALDAAGYSNVAILAYSAKYASGFYGPFREAAESAPRFGDRRAYQMDPPNAREALREIALDIAESADMVMVKPALAYLDVIARARERFDIPLAAYNVSGEYAMIKAAARNGWLDERRVVMELLTGIKRAGADFISSYHAKDVAGWLKRG